MKTVLITNSDLFASFTMQCKYQLLCCSYFVIPFKQISLQLPEFAYTICFYLSPWHITITSENNPVECKEEKQKTEKRLLTIEIENSSHVYLLVYVSYETTYWCLLSCQSFICKRRQDWLNCPIKVCSLLVVCLLGNCFEECLYISTTGQILSLKENLCMSSPVLWITSRLFVIYTMIEMLN